MKLNQLSKPWLSLFALLVVFTLNAYAEQPDMPTAAPVTPVTPAPVTPAPVTPAPVTPAPVTPAPVTPAPVTPAPVVPATPAPVTTSAPTAAPVTETQPPTKPDPVTPAPVATPAPVTPATDAPTLAPVVAGTKDPTASPTVSPTSSPTASPVEVIVTPAPVEVNVTPEPTVMPSMSPTAVSVPADSMAPTAKATAAPTGDTTAVEETLKGLEMKLFGIDSMPDADQTVWADLTFDYSKRFFSTESNLGISQLSGGITVDDVVTTSGRRLRGLEQEEASVTILYTQTMSYFTSDPDFSPEMVAQQPFLNPASQEAYLGELNDFGQGVLADVTGVSPVTVSAESPTSSPTASPTVKDDDDEGGDEDDGLSTGAIIGIAVGGGVGLILLLVCCCFMSGRGDDSDSHKDPPPSVNVRTGGDEVSTLAGPQMTSGGPTSNESIAGYGDQSVATVDYDYSKAYGGGADTSVSSAGGTFGSQNQTALDPSTAAAQTALGGAGSFNDGDSFEQHYRDPGSNVKEELINVFAPPGKLGVVIDTPDDGAPVVHAVKDSSVISDKIRVGDKLVAVDDEDVRTMTAIKVSKLISRKSANPSRKLTIIRTSVIQ